MNRSVAGAIAAAVALLLPMGAAAHVGFVVPVYELPPAGLPDLHDGTLEDWAEELPNAALTHNDFSVESGELDPQDFAFRVFLAWSWREQRIYLGVESIDDERVVPGDWMRFMIDGDHSGPGYGDESGLSQQELAALHLEQAQIYNVDTLPGEDQVKFQSDAPALEWSWSPPYADVGLSFYGENPTQTIFELALTPWDQLDTRGPDYSRPTRLEPGAIFGFHLALWDVDGGSTSAFLFPEFRYIDEVDRFADGELIPCAEPGCSQAETVIAATSWARIKAAVR